MVNAETPTVRLYVREKGGKRNFYPAPRNPDLAACYWLRYEKDGKQTWLRVGHYDLVAREKLLLERRLSAQTQGFIIPEDQAAEKASGSRVTIRSAVDAYLESLRIKNRPKKTIGGKTYELGLFASFCKKSHMDELVNVDMLGFRDYLRSEDYAERTVYNYLMTVTTFLKKNPAYRLPAGRSSCFRQSALAPAQSASCLGRLHALVFDGSLAPQMNPQLLFFGFETGNSSRLGVFLPTCAHSATMRSDRRTGIPRLVGSPCTVLRVLDAHGAQEMPGILERQAGAQSG